MVEQSWVGGTSADPLSVVLAAPDLLWSGGSSFIPMPEPPGAAGAPDAARSDPEDAASVAADGPSEAEINEVVQALRDWRKEIIFYVDGVEIARTIIGLFDHVPGQARPAESQPLASVTAPVGPEIQAYWANLERGPAGQDAGILLVSAVAAAAAAEVAPAVTEVKSIGDSGPDFVALDRAPDPPAGAPPETPPAPPEAVASWWDSTIAATEADVLAALADGVDGLIATVDAICAADDALGHPLERLGGVLSIVGGVSEAFVGAVEAAAASLTVAGAVPGIAAALNGLDNAWAGVKTVLTGEAQDTYTQQLVGAEVETLTGSATAGEIAKDAAGLLSPSEMVALGGATTRAGRKMLEIAARDLAAKAAEAKLAAEAGEAAGRNGPALRRRAEEGEALGTKAVQDEKAKLEAGGDARMGAGAAERRELDAETLPAAAATTELRPPRDPEEAGQPVMVADRTVTAPPAETAEKVDAFDFGAYLRKNIGDPPPGMLDPHAHHILFKTGLGPAQKALVQEGQALLRRFGIDPIKGLENLVWARMREVGQHRYDGLKKVVDELKAVEAEGGDRADVAAKLKRLGQEASRRRRMGSDG